jgi:hypothetical protein
MVQKHCCHMSHNEFRVSRTSCCHLFYCDDCRFPEDRSRSAFSYTLMVLGFGLHGIASLLGAGGWLVRPGRRGGGCGKLRWETFWGMHGPHGGRTCRNGYMATCSADCKPDGWHGCGGAGAPLLQHSAAARSFSFWWRA